MYKSILKELASTEIFALVSLVIFVTVFAGAIIYALTIRKDLVEQMKQVPFDDNYNPDNNELNG
jgi:hypothetical protein